jgi:REP element-mobilizing transposase RayT
MPDHVHFLLTARSEGADFKKMVARWKQATGFEWSVRHGRKLWQHGYWERVLRDADDPLSVARYIVENPVRAQLVEHPMQYPLSGSTEFTMDEICAAVQMKGWCRM